METTVERARRAPGFRKEGKEATVKGTARFFMTLCRKPHFPSPDAHFLPIMSRVKSKLLISCSISGPRTSSSPASSSASPQPLDSSWNLAGSRTPSTGTPQQTAQTGRSRGSRECLSAILHKDPLPGHSTGAFCACALKSPSKGTTIPGQVQG